jgi:hypothetical protein
MLIEYYGLTRRSFGFSPVRRRLAGLDPMIYEWLYFMMICDSDRDVG